MSYGENSSDGISRGEIGRGEISCGEIERGETSCSEILFGEKPHMFKNFQSTENALFLISIKTYKI